jgi:cobyrinic acid a,c-diamide synthase
MTKNVTVGYRTAVARRDNSVMGAHTEVRGHVHHYSAVTPSGDALNLTGRTGATTEGFSSPTLLASYLHLHLGADPAPAERFVDKAARTS